MNPIYLKSPGRMSFAISVKRFFILAMFLASQFAIASAQKQKDVEVVLHCIEYIGNDKFVANFGYNNPNKTEVDVPETNSTVVLNGGESKSKAINKFKPGLQSYVFKREFTSKDRVEWKVILPNGSTKTITANIKSNHCSNSGNIVPYYPPPANGKLLNSIIGPELTSLYTTFIATNTAVSNYIFQIRDSKVLIEIKTKTGYYNTLLGILTGTLGFEPDPASQYVDPANNLITGWIPIVNLLTINTYPTYAEFARPVFPSVLNNSGLALDKGDYSMHSDFVRKGYDLSGNGVKIGVLSDSYNSKGKADIDVLNGDLPGKDDPGRMVQVVKDYPYSFAQLSDEGRGMLQIVHDIAPGANLAFRTGYISPVDMAAGIVELADNGCNIIVDDINYITEPFFSDGIISNAVDKVVARGVTYFSAAGNFGKKSYSATFKPSAVQGPAGLTGAFHDFGTGDIYQKISLAEGNYVIVMQWADASNALNDYDVYLANDNGTTLFGFNRNNTGTVPIEILPFTVKPGGASTNILITRASGTQNLQVKYVVFRGDLAILEYNTGTSTIVGQANALGAITVGAVLYSNTPYYGVNPPTIASFSSAGGTPVNGIVRSKPDVTAPNGVNTTVPLSTFDLDGDGNFEFYGTSAAAPHAAAVAALLTEAKKKI